MPVLPATVESKRRFALWRLALWVVLLLAAFGALQYVQHARMVYDQLPVAAAADPGIRSTLQTMLAWDVTYLVAATVLVVLCAAGILRQPWARVPLRVALASLAIWMVASGVMMLRQWHAIPPLPSNVPDFMALRLAQMRRAVALSAMFKAITVLLSGWLVWRLGNASVQAQFRPSRKT